MHKLKDLTSVAFVSHAPEREYVRLEEALPEKTVRVIVVCRSFRCKGYLDQDGVWKDDRRNDKLADVIGWIPLS